MNEEDSQLYRHRERAAVIPVDYPQPARACRCAYVERDHRTAYLRGIAPQGAPVSPVMANLFLHYAFDTWMGREFPSVWFERYADDAVLHCVTERQARQVLAALTDRMAEVGLRLHPAKTRIVYCRDGNRQGSYEHTAFTFLGYTFRARRNRSRHGNQFLAFDPAVSKDALKKMGREVRR
ncbi:reverse transcriptase domain-containing protein [Streptomyces sp. NPDC051639]|uniref:reverse transcriptase domain-containing protein n=1 Tax=unclassified Streptomyces TaxID=2593676 RepID=UPI00341ECF99